MIQHVWRTLWARLGRPLGLLLLALSAGLFAGCAGTTSGCAPAKLAYVGAEGGQLHALRLDACTGTLVSLGPVASVPRPRWAVVHPTLPVLYVASDENAKEGVVVAYAIDRATGALAKVNDVAVGSGGTTHLWLDAPSMTLLAANFSAGSTTSLVVQRDGSLGARVSTLKASGSGPHRRQTGPRAHGTAVDPSGRYALAADMGADRVFVYGFDRANHVLSPDSATEPKSFATPAGSGPRRAVFGADGRVVYVLNELTAEVMVLRWDVQQGRLSLVQALPTSSAAFKGGKSTAEIVVSHDGRFVYVADRGESALVVFRADAATGELTLMQRTGSGGETPWAFGIDASGRWMLVANQRSQKVSLFGIDPVSGQLKDTGQSVGVPAPLSVTFVN
jgi:6-phosphogluconolactonase